MIFITFFPSLIPAVDISVRPVPANSFFSNNFALNLTKKIIY